MNTDLIELNVQAGIATLHLNRPDKRNALNDELREQLVSALERAAADRDIRALVLTGNGTAFCAGGDIGAMAQRLETPLGEVGFNGWRRQQQVHHSLSLLHTLPMPTIAAVNGPAAGLGADMALACDFVIASRDATFAWSYINRGLIPDGGSIYFLPRRVGLVKAKELIFSGRRVDAEEALQLGIADRLSSSESLLDDARAWAASLGKGSRTALALGKSILNQSFELSAAQVFALGSQAQGICYTSTEHRDSVKEFLQKGTPARHQGAPK
jgi:enoyl-CoA hydratase/carnithine racemase